MIRNVPIWPTVIGLCVGLLVLIGLSWLVHRTSDTADVDRSSLVRSSISPPKSFNPVTAKETSTSDVTQLMFIGLTQTDGETGKVVPDLARGWHTPDGGQTWVFKLKQGLSWSDGEPLTASDVVFTYQHLYLNPNVRTSTRSFLLLEGRSPDVRKTSKYTIEFEYHKPFAPFPRAASAPIMPEHRLHGLVNEMAPVQRSDAPSLLSKSKQGTTTGDIAGDWRQTNNGSRWIVSLNTDTESSAVNRKDALNTLEQIYLEPSVRQHMIGSDKTDWPTDAQPVGTEQIQFDFKSDHEQPPAVLTYPIWKGSKLDTVRRELTQAGDINSAWAVNTDPDTIIVNGPFKLQRYQTDRRVVLARNNHYYGRADNGDELPRLDEIVFGVVKNTEIQLLKFLRSELDVLGVSARHYQLIKPRESNEKFTVHDQLGPGRGSLFLTFNMNTDTDPKTGDHHIPEYKLDWFNDQAFRTAVAHSIDRQNLIKIALNGMGTPRYGPISPANKQFFHNNLPEYEYSPRKARRILETNGYKDRDSDGIREGPDGNPVSFVLNTNTGNDQRVLMSEIVRKDLANIGFDVTFNQIEFNTLVSKMNSRFDWEAVIIGLTGSLDPHFGSNVWKSSGGLHMWHPRQSSPERDWEAEIDSIFQQAAQEPDSDRRIKMYNRFQEIVNDRKPFIYLVTGQQMIASWDRFTDFNPTSLGGYTHNIEQIGVQPSSGPAKTDAVNQQTSRRQP